MRETVRVSIVVSAFNRGEYLREALDSALAQDFDGFEVVVVDDGSTDATPEVARSYGDRIRYHRQENAGQSAALNRAVDLARGTYLALLDSDDAWFPGKLARQVPRLDATPSAGLLYAEVEYVDEEGRPIPDARRPRCTPSGRVLKPLLRQNFIRTPTVLLRRALFLEAGGYDPSLACANDWDMWLRIAARHEVLYDASLSARYRLHGDQAVRNRWRMAEERVRVLEQRLGYIGEHAPDLVSPARRALARAVLSLARLHLRAGDRARARELVGRAMRLAPHLSLDAARIWVSESLRRRGAPSRPD